MCGSRVPQAPVQPVAPTPVRADQSVDLAPELVKANDADLDIKKKKVKKSGTSLYLQAMHLSELNSLSLLRGENSSI